MMDRLRRIFGIGVSVVAVTAVASVFLGSWYTVDQGERGVVLRNGALTGVAEPGLGFKLPVFDSVKYISVQTNSRLYENLATYSKDQQPADITLSVTYRIPVDAVSDVYSQYGGVDGLISRVVDRKVLEQLKNVFGQFNAVTAIQERARLNLEVANAITNSISGPIMVESVQIENIDFSDAYEESIEQRMVAEVEVQKLKQNAEREKVSAQITVTKAQAEADSRLAVAKAEAEAIRLRGDAEAYAIEARSKALASNQEIVELTKAEKWNGTLPTTMVPGATVPFLNVR
jgi:regulator of protease activity HflC (stomatin/prohibitin superfamily)